MTSRTATAWLERAAFLEMLDEAARQGRLETGGVLLGWRHRDAVVVTHTLGPGPRASHEQRAFSPDNAWQAAEIAHLYEESGRTLAYLGDWHTHPGGVARPSRRDETTLARIASTPDARCDDPVMMILGSDAPQVAEWNLRAFVLTRRRTWLSWRSPVTEVPLHLTPDAQRPAVPR